MMCSLFCFPLRREITEDEEEKDASAATEDQEEATGPSHASPDTIVRMERLRVMGEEKRNLQLLLEREEAEIKQLDAAVSDLRQSALMQVERLQSAGSHVDSARQFAKDHASCC